MAHSTSKLKRKSLTMRDLLQSSEFWEENIKTEIFNVIQDYMDENELNRKELAEKIGVSKGYISQVLNGDSDHRLSKLVALALAAGKVPYIYLKDLNLVLEQDDLGNSVFIDFNELEKKAKKCDVYKRVIQNSNSFLVKKRRDKFIGRITKNSFGKHASNIAEQLIQKSNETIRYNSSKTMSNAA